LGCHLGRQRDFLLEEQKGCYWEMPLALKMGYHLGWH